MKRKERNRETNTNNNHMIIMRRKKKMKVVKIRDDPLVHIEEKLDPDMQLDIFSRLPFKEAVRCRQVCKSWRILLDDNFLINNHPKTPLKLNSEYHAHAHAHAHHNNYSYSSSSSRLSFISMPRTSPHDDDDDDDDDDNKDVIFGVYDDDYDMCSYKESRSSFKYHPSTTSFRNERTIISSCNGLICLKTNEKDYWLLHHENLFPTYSITIYNPITKEKLNLCTYDDVPCYPPEYKILTCGFGYHPSTKQYKILRCSSYDNNNHEFQQLWFEIYTLGTTGGKWRQIKAPPEDPPNFDYHVPGVHVNGALYWITNYFKNKKKRMMIIMSFDLGDEVFQIITPLPPPHSNISKKQVSSLHYKLKESLGCLYLIVYYHSYIEIWLMIKREKKRRMHEKTEKTNKYKCDHRHHYYWTKVMKIRIDHHRQGEYKFVGLTKSGKVLFWHNRVLTCCDPKTKRFESLSSSSSSSSSSSGAYPRTFVPHVNSLVSLMALQSIDTNGEEKKYLRISKVSKFTLQANATTGEKKYAVEEEYEKFV